MMLQALLIQQRWDFRIRWQAELPETQGEAIRIKRRIVPPLPMEPREEESCRSRLRGEMDLQQPSPIGTTRVRCRLYIRQPLTTSSLFAISTRRYLNRLRT